MTPLRILQVSTSDYGGGAEGSAWNLFQAYRRRGIDSWLAVGQKLSDNADVLLIPNEANRPVWTRMWRQTQSRDNGTLLNPLTQTLGRLAGLGEPRRIVERRLGIEDFHYPGTWRLLDLPPQRPTVIHCHNLHGNYFDLRALPWLSKQVPVILNLRDAWTLTGHCAHSFECERWKTGCGDCPDLTIYPAVTRDATAYNWRRKRDIYARSRLYLTTPSQWLMDQVRKSMLHGIEYRVIPNGIDLTVFHPGYQVEARSTLGLPTDCKIVLFASSKGRSNPWRDYAMMEAALQQVANQTQGTGLLFVCLGEEGKEESLGKLRIHFVTFERDQKRLVQYYQAADVYVHAAKAEAFGKTITEALACGTPVVATAVGGIPEQVEDGCNGFLVPPGDDKAMAIRLAQLLENDDLRRRFGGQAVESARRFDLQRQVDTFLEWYEELTAE